MSRTEHKTGNRTNWGVRMNAVLDKLAGRDRRSIGRSNEVVADVLRNPTLFNEVFNGMLADDPVIRMRSADATEKITAKHPEYLRGYKRKLIYNVASIEQQEVRWHVAQMVPRLALTEQESKAVVETLMNYLLDRSSIVRTFAMQALADLAEKQASLRPRVVELLEKLTRTGSPAMKSRGRKLLKKLRPIEV